jgi:hypothetical protein
MDMLTECIRALWRRRWWTILACVVALAAGAGAFLAVPPVQRTTAQVLFVPSVKQPGVDGPTNPFLSLGGSVAVVASIIQAEVSDDQTAAALAKSGHKAKYEVVPNLTENAGPVLIITTEDVDVDQSQGTMKAVIGAIKESLRTIQADQHIQSDLMVTSVVLTSSKALPVRKAQAQVAVGASAAVLVLLVGIILLVERRQIRKQMRRRAQANRSGRPRPAQKGAPGGGQRPAPARPGDPPRRPAPEDERRRGRVPESSDSRVG